MMTDDLALPRVLHEFDSPFVVSDDEHGPYIRIDGGSVRLLHTDTLSITVPAARLDDLHKAISRRFGPLPIRMRGVRTGVLAWSLHRKDCAEQTDELLDMLGGERKKLPEPVGSKPTSSPADDDPAAGPAGTPKPAKRGPGRPRKQPVESKP